MSKLSAGPAPASDRTSPSASILHVVQADETLGGIVLRYQDELKKAGVWTAADDLWKVVHKVAELNGRADPNQLNKGDRLLIPHSKETKDAPFDELPFEAHRNFAAAAASSLRVEPRLPELEPAPRQTGRPNPVEQSSRSEIFRFAALSTTPSVENAAVRSTAPVIMLDPGHGGRDGGAAHGGRTEAQITLHFCELLADELRTLGYQVKFTHQGLKPNEYLSPEKRFDLINGAKPDLAISVHVNAHKGRGTAHGHEVYHGSDRGGHSRVFAHALDRELDAVASEMRFDTTRPVRAGDYWVTAAKDLPSVLLELDFIKNSKAQQDDYLRAQVAATVAAVQNAVPLEQQLLLASASTR